MFWLYHNYLRMYVVYLHISQGCSIGTEPIVSLSQSLLNNPEIRLKVMEYDMDNDFYQIIAKNYRDILYRILQIIVQLLWSVHFIFLHHWEAKEWSNHTTGICLRKQKYTHAFLDKEALFVLQHK